MNNRKMVFTVFMFCLAAALYSQAENDFVLDGTILVKYQGTANEVIVPASLGIKQIGNYAFHNAEMTAIVIPPTVVSIADLAFARCENLVKINIPANVASIGKSVFSGCTSLSEITVDRKNRAYTSLDGVLFDKAITILLKYPPAKKGQSYSIPKTVKQIDHYAFAENEIIANITIPLGITEIADFSFMGCTKLVSIVIPATVTSIGVSSFNGCQSLREITIPASVKIVADFAFSNCRSLPQAVRDDIRNRFGEWAIFDRGG